MENNKLTVKELNKAQLNAFSNSYNAILDTSAVDNITQARLKLNTADYLKEKTLLPICRLYYLVKEKELFKQADFKNFELWAKKERKLGRSTAFNYAKVGEMVTADGLHTIFNDGVNDFNYTALNYLIARFTDKVNGYNANETAQAIRDNIDSGKISLEMSITDLKKALQPPKGAKNELTEKDGASVDGEKDGASVDEKDGASVDGEKDGATDYTATIEKSALFKKWYPLFIEITRTALNAPEKELSIYTALAEIVE